MQEFKKPKNILKSAPLSYKADFGQACEIHVSDFYSTDLMRFFKCHIGLLGCAIKPKRTVKSPKEMVYQE